MENDNNLNVFEFFKLIYRNKLIILNYSIIFLILGFAFSKFYQPTYKAKLIITPLSQAEFENFYINENKIFNDGKIIIDDILLNDTTPLTLFYSFLNELKKEKIKLNITNLNITFNPFSKLYEIYIEDTLKDLDLMNKNFMSLTNNTNQKVIQKIINNINLQLNTINAIKNINKENISKVILKKEILSKNLETIQNLENLKIVSFDTKNTKIKSNLPRTNNILIISFGIGIIIALIHILFNSYFNRQKS